MLVVNIGGVEGASRVSGKPMHMHRACVDVDTDDAAQQNKLGTQSSL